MPTNTGTTLPAALLTDERRALLTARLARYVKREDVEVLGILGVRAGQYVGDYYSHAGIGFVVEFTYTTGRRQRRTREIGWPTTGTNGDRRLAYTLLPQTLLDMISEAVAAALSPSAGV